MFDPQFLQLMGAVLVANSGGGEQINDDGTVIGAGGKWTPRSTLPDMTGVFAAMRAQGIDPTGFGFLAYDVLAANPFHGGAINLVFPPRLVVRGLTPDIKYAVEHDLGLVLSSPASFVTELLAAGVKPTLDPTKPPAPKPDPNAPGTPTPLPGQPNQPVGKQVDGKPGIFEVVPGDLHPDGAKVMLGPLVFLRRKVVSPFGSYDWWEIVAA